MRNLTCIWSFILISLCNGFYVPLATSSSVTKIAKSIGLEDSTVVVSRNSTGHPVAFHDFCPHRGASFNNAIIKDDSISCPYHGFEFETIDGELSGGVGVKPGCSSLKMIDCIDRGGLLWACVDGHNEVGPPPTLTQSSDPTFRRTSGSVIVKCPVNRLIENVIDCLHPSVVHSFGNRMDPEPKSYNTRKLSSTSGTGNFEYNAGPSSMFSGALDVHNWYHIPCTAGTLVRSGDNVKIVQVHAVQLPGGYTKVFWELYRNWLTHPIMDVVFNTVMGITLDEDKDILEKCSFEKGDRFNGKYDKLQLLYRKSMKEHQK